MKFNITTKHIFLYGLGLISMKAISLLMLPIVTRILSPAEYGTLEVLLTLMNLLYIVLGFGLSDAIFRFGGMGQTTRVIEQICRNATLQAFIISFILCIPMIFFADKIALLLPGNVTSFQIIYLVIALIPSNVLVVQLDWLRLNENIKAFVWINLIRALIQAIMVLITLFAGYGVTGIMFSSIISNLLIFFYFVFIQLKSNLQFNIAWQKKLFLYGLPLSFSGIAEFITLWLANWWLAFVIGPAEMAQFALAMKLSFLTILLMEPVILWWFPNRFKHLGSIAERAYTAKISEVGVILGFIFALGVTLASSILIKCFIPASYHKAISYLPWLCFMFAIKNAGGMMNTGLFIEKTHFQMFINTLTALFTVIGFYFLIPYKQAWGVIIVLNLVFTFRWFAFTYLSQKEIYLPYRYLKLVIFIIIIGSTIASIQWMTSLYDYLIKGGTLLVLVVIFSFYLKLLEYSNN